MSGRLFDYLVAYLEERGWRFVPEPDAHYKEKRTGNWWTRDEFAGWWRDPRTEEISDRYVDFARAVHEQIEMEEYGVTSVREMLVAQMKGSRS